MPRTLKRRLSSLIHSSIKPRLRPPFTPRQYLSEYDSVSARLLARGTASLATLRTKHTPTKDAIVCARSRILDRRAAFRAAIRVTSTKNIDGGESCSLSEACIRTHTTSSSNFTHVRFLPRLRPATIHQPRQTTSGSRLLPALFSISSPPTRDETILRRRSIRSATSRRALIVLKSICPLKTVASYIETPHE